METLSEFQKVEPETALANWVTGSWTDRQFKHWLIIRNEINGAKADKVIDDLKKARAAA